MKAGALLAGLLTASLLAFAAAPAMFQDRLLYYPAPASVAELSTPGLRPWPAADDFRGLVAQPAGTPRASAIVFHGNAGHAGHRSYYATALTRLGLTVILAEYPAYGPRGGVVGERSLVDDAQQSIALARRLHGGPLIVVGESLGAGVAAAAVARAPDQADGLLLITPWDRLSHVAGEHYPWLPVHWLLRDRYDSVDHLAAFTRPVLVVVAAQDRIVPARFGRALHDALRGPKRLEVIEGAGHNDWLGRIDEAWWRRAIEFLLPPPPAAAN